jgi:hypothetical protein
VVDTCAKEGRENMDANALKNSLDNGLSALKIIKDNLDKLSKESDIDTIYLNEVDRLILFSFRGKDFILEIKAEKNKEYPRYDLSIKAYVAGNPDDFKVWEIITNINPMRLKGEEGEMSITSLDKTRKLIYYFIINHFFFKADGDTPFQD